MLKLHQLFFRNFLIILSITLFISGFVSYFTLKNIELNHFEDNLKSNINIIEIELLNSKNRDLNRYSASFENINDLRITLIDAKGVVLADSSKDIKEMDNHLNRPEIVQSKTDKYGISIRHSATTNMDYLYVAKKIGLNGSSIYIRMAVLIDRIMSDFYNLWFKVTLIFAISIVFALFIKFYINKKITQEVERITDFLHHLSNKKYRPINSKSFTEEFNSIFILLEKVAKKLKKRDKQKKKFTRELLLKNRQNREIISAMSHEFKNPVAVILGYSETLTQDKDMNENIRDKFLGKISQNAKRISDIVDRITIAIKLENQDLTLKISSFEIKALIQNVENLLKYKYKDREVEIIGEDRKIEADKTLIELVLINLIENALKYSDDNITVEINSNEIKIIDRGIGISKEDINRVTQKFYRVDKHIWNNSLGLGLNIVKYILKMHNTFLDIESRLDEGSVFSFKI